MQLRFYSTVTCGNTPPADLGLDSLSRFSRGSRACWPSGCKPAGQPRYGRSGGQAWLLILSSHVHVRPAAQAATVSTCPWPMIRQALSGYSTVPQMRRRRRILAVRPVLGRGLTPVGRSE